MAKRLIVDEIEKHDAHANVIGLIEMKTLTLYLKEDVKDTDYWKYNKSDLPFLSFEEYDEEISQEIGKATLKESLRINLSYEESAKLDKFLTEENSYII